ncbi:MAG: hypothetical protein ACYCX7_11370, partial [Solirubrobacteraceae bacterium]
PDASGRQCGVPELLDAMLERLSDVASELDCVGELERLPGLVRRGGGAGAQREIYDIAGMGALLRDWASLTAASAELGSR